MTDNVLVTGGSGYLGGTMLFRLADEDKFPPYNLYATVRNYQQAEGVKLNGAIPLEFDMQDEKAVLENILKYKINIVFHLIDAFNSDIQLNFIKALAELNKATELECHFLHTTGAKMFSSLVGAPQEPFADTDANLYDVQKDQVKRQVPFPAMLKAAETNNTVIEECEKAGVHSYIFIPCIVYGKGMGFGNLVSIQTKAVVQAAQLAEKVYRFERNSSWPVCQVRDTADLYIQLLRKMLEKANPGSGQKGYYLAASGFAKWEDIYSGIAKAMVKRGVLEDDSVHDINDDALEVMARALDSPKEMVAPQLSGNCTLLAKRGLELGWKPQFGPEHILEALDDEVALILENTK